MPRKQTSNPLEDKINEIKKAISVLEWDIPLIKNDNIRFKKEDNLSELKNELNRLLEEKKKDE